MSTALLFPQRGFENSYQGVAILRDGTLGRISRLHMIGSFRAQPIYREIENAAGTIIEWSAYKGDCPTPEAKAALRKTLQSIRA